MERFQKKYLPNDFLGDTSFISTLKFGIGLGYTFYKNKFELWLSHAYTHLNLKYDFNSLSIDRQNGQTHSTNSLANCQRIVLVCLTSLWGWR